MLIDYYPYLSLGIFYKVILILRLLKKLEETFELSWKAKNVVKLFKLMTMVLFISHIFACVWLYESTLLPMNEGDEF